VAADHSSIQVGCQSPNMSEHAQGRFWF